MASYKQILDDITCDTCNGQYCILKEMILHLHHPDSRTTLQIKCIDKLKYELSEIEGKDVGYEETFNKWVDEGYAKAYADIYDEGLSFKKLYSMVKSMVKKAIEDT